MGDIYTHHHGQFISQAELHHRSLMYSNVHAVPIFSVFSVLSLAFVLTGGFLSGRMRAILYGIHELESQQATQKEHNISSQMRWSKRSCTSNVSLEHLLRIREEINLLPPPFSLSKSFDYHFLVLSKLKVVRFAYPPATIFTRTSSPTCRLSNDTNSA